MVREAAAAGNYAAGNANRSAARANCEKTIRTAGQSGATSTAWPVWALFVTASVNSM